MDNDYIKATRLSLKIHIDLRGSNELLSRYLKLPSQNQHQQHVPKSNRSSTSSTTSTTKTRRKVLPKKPTKSPTKQQQPSKEEEEEEELNKIMVPHQFLHCDPEIVIILINRMLSSLIKINDTSTANTPPTRFHSKTPPAIQIYTYLNRLKRFNCLNSSILLTTIYYIDVLSYNYACFTLNSWTVHRFLLVATMIAQKALEDFFYTNDHYAKVGGVSLQELNCLELDFLKRVDWRTIPIQNPNVQQLYYTKLVEMTGNSLGNDDSQYQFTKFIMQTDNTKEEQDEDDDDKEMEDEDDFYDSEDSDQDDDEDDIDDDDIDEGDSSIGELSEIPMYKYDSKGFSIDGTSSPHLKRRYSDD
ncbi:PHO80 PHO85 cyclin PHO80 [Candida maltosa Xu316]